MSTDKEIEAAAEAYLHVGSGSLRADFGGRDITIPFAYMRAKAALEAAEKVRAEATTKREEKLQKALEPLKGALQLKHPDTFKSGWNEAMKYIKQAIQQED